MGSEVRTGNQYLEGNVSIPIFLNESEVDMILESMNFYLNVLIDQDDFKEFTNANDIIVKFRLEKQKHFIEEQKRKSLDFPRY